MARKRASMREGPLAELFRATEAAQRQEGDDEPVDEPLPPAAEARRAADPDHAGAGERAGCHRARAAPPRGSGARGDSRARRPVPAASTRREEAALEETVEHVHDFDVAPGSAAPDAPAAEEPVAAVAPPVAEPTPHPCPWPRAPAVAAPAPAAARARPRGPSRRTSLRPAASSSRCPRVRHD